MVSAGELRAALEGLDDDTLVTMTDQEEETTREDSSPMMQQPPPAPTPIRPRHLHALIDLGNDVLIAPAHVSRVAVARGVMKISVVGAGTVELKEQKDMRYFLAEMTLRGFLDPYSE